MTLSIEEVILEKLDTIEKIVTGNGDPQKGLVVIVSRIEEKQDAAVKKIDEHLINKEIHRTEMDSQKKMMAVALWLLPISLVILAMTFFTLHGDWVKIGEIISKWLGV
jgi:hypothetical protein